MKIEINHLKQQIISVQNEKLDLKKQCDNIQKENEIIKENSINLISQIEVIQAKNNEMEIMISKLNKDKLADDKIDIKKPNKNHELNPIKVTSSFNSNEEKKSKKDNDPLNSNKIDQQEKQLIKKDETNYMIIKKDDIKDEISDIRIINIAEFNTFSVQKQLLVIKSILEQRSFFFKIIFGFFFRKFS